MSNGMPGGFGYGQAGGDPHAYWKQYGYGGSIAPSTQIAEGNFQGNAAYGQAQDTRSQQAAFGQQMAAEMNGPTYAETVAQQQMAQNSAAAASMAAGARGGNMALQQKAAADAAARGNAQIAGNAQANAISERFAAKNAYSQYLAGMRGQDLSGAGLQYGRAEQWGGVGNQANANANQSRSLDQQQSAQDWGKVKDYAMMAGGAALLMSDQTLKTDVKPAESSEMRGFLDALDGYHYRYKGDDKPRAGIMAQDLEKSAIGKTIVRETPIGKAVDTNMGFGVVLAALADTNKRLKAGGL